MTTASLHVSNESEIRISDMSNMSSGAQCIHLDNNNNIFFTNQQELINFANTILALTKEQSDEQ